MVRMYELCLHIAKIVRGVNRAEPGRAEPCEEEQQQQQLLLLQVLANTAEKFFSEGQIFVEPP